MKSPAGFLDGNNSRIFNSQHREGEEFRGEERDLVFLADADRRFVFKSFDVFQGWIVVGDLRTQLIHAIFMVLMEMH